MMRVRVNAGDLLGRPASVWTAGALALVLALAVFVLPPRAVVAAAGGLAAVTAAFFAPRQGFFLWLVTTPVLSLWVFISLGAGVPDITYNRVVIGVITSVIVLRMLLGFARRLPFGRMEAAMLAFVLIAGLSLYKSHNLTTDLQCLLDCYTVPYLVYWLSRVMFRQQPATRGLLWCLVALGALLAGLGGVQELTHHTPLVPAGFSPIHPGRMTGPFVNAAEFGGVMAMIVCVCLAFGPTLGTVSRRVIASVVAILLAAVVLSMTRAVWLGAMVGVGIVARGDRVARRLLWASLAIVVVAGVVALPALGERVRLKERGGDIAPVYNRLVSTPTALRMWIRKPIFGYGFGLNTYYENSREFIQPVGSVSARWGREVTVPHNEYLHILVLTGLSGLVTQIVIFLGAIRMARRRRYLPPGAPRAMALGVAGATAVYLTNGLFADLMFFNFHAMLFFLLLGALAGITDATRADGDVDAH